MKSNAAKRGRKTEKAKELDCPEWNTGGKAMTKIGIFFGGRSEEHEVSLMSAASVLRVIDRSKFRLILIGITRQGKWLLYDGPTEYIADGRWEALAQRALSEHPETYEIIMGSDNPLSLGKRIDFALPLLHGPYGEDGTLQGLFESMNIPYAGCGVLSSAVAMDKIVARDIFHRAGLTQPGYLRTNREEISRDSEALMQKIEREIGYPAFVKPANMGSSVGLSKVKDRRELAQALMSALRYDRRIIVEQGIFCREVEIAVLGNYEAQLSAVGEIISANEEFYDYDSKYNAGDKTKLCIPAELSQEQEARLRAMAKAAYEAIDGTGFARVDFLIDKCDGTVYINEINTIPGFTEYSMFPRLWLQSGLSYPQLIERIVELGYARYNAENRRQAGDK